MKSRAVFVSILFLALCPALCIAASRNPVVFVKGTSAGGGSTASETTGRLVKICPSVVVTLDAERADYTLVRDAGSGMKPQKITVFNKAQVLIYSGATLTVNAAVKDACKAILKDWGHEEDGK